MFFKWSLLSRCPNKTVFVFLNYCTHATVNSDNNTDIKARIMARNRSYYSVMPLLRSKAISRTTKIRMYKTIIRPVVLYGSKA
jgi:hypothetical protein